MASKKLRIGFVSTRFSGTDGVSLEVEKWVDVLHGLGHETYFFSGESEWPDERCYLVEEAHFLHPEIRKLNIDLFDDYQRYPETTKRIQHLRELLKQELYKYIDRFDPDVLLVENALSLPMNVPLGLAITELAAEAAIPILAHHHDFAWERKRYIVSAAEDYLGAAFPPTLHHIRHVVINTYAQRQLALRTGASSVVIPNVMDFDNPPPPPDDYADNLREELGVNSDRKLLLQPTRIVPRKRIEQAIELSARLSAENSLVITHHAGDEGMEYKDYLKRYADVMDVDLIFAAERFAPERGRTEEGEKIYSLRDAYYQADIVTYPSIVEGFGNAFLETIYYKRPIMMSAYEIFKTDIQPKGFDIITFDDFIRAQCIQQVEEVLENPDLEEEMVEHNYEIACLHYSYTILERKLQAILDEMVGLEPRIPV